MSRRISDEQLDPAIATFLSVRHEEIVAGLDEGGAVARLGSHSGTDDESPRRRVGLPLLSVAIAIAVAGAIVVGPLGGGPSAAAILERAEDRFGTVPAFRAIVETVIPGRVLRAEYPDHDGSDVRLERAVSYAGPDAWRRDTLSMVPAPLWVDGGPGSFWVWDGSALGVYRADTNDYEEHDVVGSFDPLGSLGWRSPVWRSGCASGAVGSDERIAGRTVTPIDCDDARIWVDPETGLVLRFEGSDGTSEVVSSIEIGLDFPAGTFDPGPPRGAGAPTADPTPSPLQVGVRPPPWRLSSLDGSSVALADLAGGMVLVWIWADWCPPEVCLGEAIRDAAALDATLLSIAISSDPANVSRVVGDEDLEVLTVVDDGTVEDAWGIDSVPLLVALDAAGRVASVSRSAPEIAATVATLAEGASPTP